MPPRVKTGDRVAPGERAAGGGNYFTAPKNDVEFVSSGSKLLDLALGGGWAEDRIMNVIGDSSTGKTLLAIEQCANYARKYRSAGVFYREAESAFLPDYAGALGMPLKRVDFGDPEKPLETVEDFYDDVSDVLKSLGRERGLYVLDSLDALSDEDEMTRDFRKGSYGAAKAKNMSKFFRQVTSQLAKQRVTMLIVSQVRDKIGALIGEKTTVSGGKALAFYCSQRIKLAQIGRIKKTVKGIERVVGVQILAKCIKNKVGLPFREAEFTVSFGYGLDDVAACLHWLKGTKVLESALGWREPKDALAALARIDDDARYWEQVRAVHDAVEKRWYEVERALIPTRRKYG